MQLWNADCSGNTFRLIQTADFGAATRYLDDCRAKNAWNFDSALVVMPEGDSVRMRILERDGSESAMCGNGLRAVIYLLDKQKARREVVVGDQRLTGLKAWFNHYRVEIGSVVTSSPYGDFLIGGEPHRIHPVDSWNKIPEIFTRQIINQDFNQTFIMFRNGALSAKTWERGVRRFTASCGTGACAAAVWFSRLVGTDQPITVTMNNHRLKVFFTPSGVLLEGAVKLCKHYGEIYE